MNSQDFEFSHEKMQAALMRGRSERSREVYRLLDKFAKLLRTIGARRAAISARPAAC